MMHSQILVIYPNNVELKNVMYPYQQIDKDIQGKLNDERCQFFLQVKEEDIPNILKEIEEYYIKEAEIQLEKMQYRAKHTIEQVKEKYGYIGDFYSLYKIYMDYLNEYKKIKNLRFDDKRQISYIKNTYDSVKSEGWVDIYIKGVGYGMLRNPYELWDYYQDASKRLIEKLLVNYNGEKSNKMAFSDLNIKATLNNIEKLTDVWEHIIFCPDDPNNSRLFTKFDKYPNNCKVTNGLEGTLKELFNQFKNENYIISAVDIHY